MSYDRSGRFKKALPALKHGGYAATIVLPGENPAEFEQLHGELIAEFGPSGALEEDTVATLAGLVWRKQNLGTVRIAQSARNRFEEIRVYNEGGFDPDIQERKFWTVDELAQKEFGDAYELVEIGLRGFGQLANELEVQEQLDSMIDKCLKRLLMLRGLKSISSGSSPKKPARIAAPAITP